MTDRPVLFSGPMVRAILEGRKTQTRRVLKPQPPATHDLVGIYAPGLTAVFNPAGNRSYGDPNVDISVGIPYRKRDRLWVKEKHFICTRSNQLCYAATDGGTVDRYKPSIHMPRWASRLTLIVTDVRVQRVQDISCADAIAEGIAVPTMDYNRIDCESPDPRHDFRNLWNSLNEKRGFGWNENPWVVAISFTAHRCNIDDLDAEASDGRAA